MLFCWSCAQQGSPSGGPRDEDPPRVLECTPPNYSTQFESRKIQITFDEYIVLDNVNQQLVVSPPMEEQPTVKLKRKSLIIEFEEALRINTTYTFNFGDAIKDLHEGNKLQNYEYVFSTGEILDSMSVRGNLKYAENLEVPDEPFSIMLYSDLRDSVPLLDIPLYVGRSDDSGVFSVNNLRPDVYKVFALKDGNNNFLFDLPSEEIAFLDFVDEIGKLFKTIEIYLTTSIHEGSSHVVLEAMASGIPVIAFDISSMPEIVSNEHTGYLVPFGDTVSFSDRIKYLKNNPELLEEMGRNAQKEVADKFEFTRNMNRVLELIEA